MSGQLLHNRLACDEHARISLRDDWLDCATATRNPRGAVEGKVISRTGHRVTLHLGEGKCVVLRRVDIETIEVRL